MSQQSTEKVIEIVRKHGVLRPRDLKVYGIPGSYLHRLYRRGLLERVSRGLYALPNSAVTEHHSLVEAVRQAPRAVVCLLSALRFHGLTTQTPFEVWLAIGSKDWQPKIDYPAIRFVRFSGKAFTEGVETYDIEGVPVKIYNPAKTVADCFKYRNKIGLDVALEALRDCLDQRKCSVNELWRYAEICRVSNIMRPYLEAML